jgi:uncharacterized membrane protein
MNSPGSTGKRKEKCKNAKMQKWKSAKVRFFAVCGGRSNMAQTNFCREESISRAAWRGKSSAP